MTATKTTIAPVSEPSKRLLDCLLHPWWKGLNSALLVSAALAGTPAGAAEFTVSPSGGVWYTGSTWVGGLVPGVSGNDSVKVQASVLGVNVSVDHDLDAEFPPTVYPIGTLQVTAPTTGSGTVKFLTGETPVNLSLKAANAAANTVLVFEDTLTLVANGLILNGDGSQGRIELNGTLADVTAADDTITDGSIVVKGGTVVFNNAAGAHSGATTLDGGKIVVAGGGFGANGGLVLNGGTLTADSATSEIPGRTVLEAVSISGGVHLGEVGAGDLELSGDVNLGGGRRVLTVAGTVTISGVLADGGTVGVSKGTLVKDGAGKLVLSGLGNSYTGGTELRAGVLVASVENALGGSTDENAALLPGGALTVEGGTLQLGADQNIAELRIKGGGIVATEDAVDPKLIVHGSSITADVAASASVKVVLGETAATKVGLSKTGLGVLELAGANFYSGDTTIRQGEVLVRSGADVDENSPLGKTGTAGGAVVLDGGNLRVVGGADVVALDKDFRVVSSGQLIAEGAGGVGLNNLTVASAASFTAAGAIAAKAVDVSGRLVLSGDKPLNAETLQAAPGAVFVWDKRDTAPTTTGIVLSTTAETDLSGAKVEFSKGYVDQAVQSTKAVVSTGSSSALQKRFEVGSLVVSGGSIKFPTVVQPGGVLRFSFNATDSKSVSIVLERSPYEDLATTSNTRAFAKTLEGFSDFSIAALISTPAALRQADGGSTFASMAGFIPQQILAVSNTVDMHLDDLSAGGAASSALSMGVRIGAPSKSVVPMSPVSSEGSSDNDWRVWTSGYGSWARIDADEATGQGKVNSAGGGGVLGLERQMGGLKAGVLVTVGESVSRSDDPYLRVRSENWNIGGYGSINIGSINLDASALWGTSDQDSRREVPNGDVATARYTTQNWQAGLGVAVNLAAENSSWQVAPVARLKYINSSEDAFEETGSVLGIGSSGNNQRHLLSKLGLRVAKSAKLTSSVAFGVDGAAYWVHDYNSQGRDLQFQFGGTPYTVRTRDREADSTQFNLGMQATFSEAVTLRLSGQQDLSQNRTQTSGVFSVAYKF